MEDLTKSRAPFFQVPASTSTLLPSSMHTPKGRPLEHAVTTPTAMQAGRTNRESASSASFKHNRTRSLQNKVLRVTAVANRNLKKCNWQTHLFTVQIPRPSRAHASSGLHLPLPHRGLAPVRLLKGDVRNMQAGNEDRPGTRLPRSFAEMRHSAH